MPKVTFEPTSPVFEGAKTFCAVDRVAPVIGGYYLSNRQNHYLLIIRDHILFDITQLLQSNRHH
jgi:hypothetical protein